MIFFPKEEYKSLAQTYFEYSEEAHKTVASLSQKCMPKQAYFKLNEYPINFALLYSPWQYCLPLLLLSLQLSGYSPAGSFSTCLSFMSTAALIVSLDLQSGQACSFQPPALLWWSELLCLLTALPGFFPQVLSFLIPWPVFSTTLDSLRLLLSLRAHFLHCDFIPYLTVGTSVVVCDIQMHLYIGVTQASTLCHITTWYSGELNQGDSAMPIHPGASSKVPDPAVTILLLFNCSGYFSPCEHACIAQTLLRWAASSHIQKWVISVFLLYCGKC